MKFPNHIILDVNANKNFYNNQYWMFKYLNNFYNIPFFNQMNKSGSTKFNSNFWLKPDNYLFENLNKFTLKYNIDIYNSDIKDLNNINRDFFINNLEVKYKSYSPFLFKNKLFYLLFQKKKNYQILKLNFFYKNNIKKKKSLINNNILWNLFNINFIKKEKIYTKLKYSRVPQYDIVSGGSAALFAGFLGFLISEKFGIELVDSGDFYYLLMYVIFLIGFLRIFLKLINNMNNDWNIFSYKWALNYFYYLFILIKKKII